MGVDPGLTDIVESSVQVEQGSLGTLLRGAFLVYGNTAEEGDASLELILETLRRDCLELRIAFVDGKECGKDFDAASATGSYAAAGGGSSESDTALYALLLLLLIPSASAILVLVYIRFLYQTEEHQHLSNNSEMEKKSEPPAHSPPADAYDLVCLRTCFCL